MVWTYEKIRKLRETLAEELRTDVTNWSVEHMKLVEMRIANILAADIDDDSINEEKKKFKKEK